MQPKSDTSADFSDRIEHLRTRLGGSLVDVARALDVSRTMLYDIKNGKVPVSRKMWLKLEQAERADRPQNEDLNPEQGSMLGTLHHAWGHFLLTEALLEIVVRARKPADDKVTENEIQELLIRYNHGQLRGRSAMKKVKEFVTNILATAHAIAAEDTTVMGQRDVTAAEEIQEAVNKEIERRHSHRLRDAG